MKYFMHYYILIHHVGQQTIYIFYYQCLDFLNFIFISLIIKNLQSTYLILYEYYFFFLIDQQ